MGLRKSSSEVVCGLDLPLQAMHLAWDASSLGAGQN